MQQWGLDCVPRMLVQFRQMVDRDRYLTLRASKEERDMLKALAEREGLTASDYVRQFIRRAYEKAFSGKARRSRA